jgi:hypothetical protein
MDQKHIPFKAALGVLPLPLIPLIAPHSPSSIIIRGWYNRPVAVLVTVHPKKEEKENPNLQSCHCRICLWGFVKQNVYRDNPHI